ncbi:tRNA (N(6)-L-threonylcarbamoyladenosine(37)-C(2))-methylthiotransferase [Methanobrevibacter sp. DSM 116169]|uniref:tRNA (N(6)-L-threonylcarbamoyladenosine(37)-C(2))- methylthiotransferase n=1 Tax=Methanobrevibacter sp. DSM 116169 TaxID=3242727 RepID=UPI0038FBFD57
MKVFIDTYGCTFNKSDSQIMAGFLKENDIDLVSSMEEADVIIINSCYVKLPTENKVTFKVQSLLDKFPNKKIIISGCMVEIDPEKLEKIGPNCSWIGPHQLNEVVDVVKKSFDGETVRATGLSKNSKVGLSKVKDNPHIHIIQICEGCLGACTFCCTRFARGPLNSYPISEIKKEAQKAIDEGAVEIQLTAQDTAAFGKDSGEKLSDLIKEIANLNGTFKIRIGMMHPKNVLDDVDELIDAFKLPRVYDFLHLPIQTASDKVLLEMKRGHSLNEYLEIVEKFKKEIPDLTLATDIIVGYPSEKEDDFNKTCEFLKQVKPGIIHLSKYQHRKGAISSSLKEIPHDVMKRRSKKITDIKSEITKEENQQLLNTIQKAIVVEQGSKGGYIAKSNSYIPIVVSDVEIGDFIDLKIYETSSTYLKGTKI